ncbi:hypothetical protein ZIOFF_023004 [Zingiber officinale]|uniref:OTU domain-containing protein n=1 Tax=Zingiber officinale TaxID=94328 RepID=A0A8J5HAJ1_ZINOF|nr:hypothetical protein ZIOFF_023004 [Zingiber officinale]
MVKSYLRYEPGLVFGVISSVDANIAYDPSGLHLLAPALDKFFLWNLKQGLAFKTFSSSTRSSHTLAVTTIAASPSSSSTSIASGHTDGSIRLWDCEKATCEATLNGHKTAVTALRYNHLTSLLASGGKDCDVILWDVVGEAGLFRLLFVFQVTDLVFIDSGKKLVTSSKDKFMRVWDLELQQCVQIVGGHHSEIWSLDVDPMERFLVSGSADSELKFYEIKRNTEVVEKESKWEVLKNFGEIQRQSKDRVAALRFNKSGNLLACQVAGKLVEIYRVLSDDEAKRKAKRRLHRKKEKLLTRDAAGGNENEGLADSLSSQEFQHPTVVVSDVFKLLQMLRSSKKISSIAFSPSDPKVGLATLSLSLNNNMLETHLVDSDKISKLYSIELQGHRSDIRSVTLSSDNDLLMSTSHNSVKIWNPTTGVCLRTIESGYGLCSSFVPGNRYALVGSKSGSLEIIDVGSGSCIEVVEAHADSIRSLVQLPDENGTVGGQGFVTGSDDRDVKFWEYTVKQKSDNMCWYVSILVNGVTNVRTLKMDEDVLAISVSPDSKYLAVSLLEKCAIKVFFMDSLKLFLSLYGHKLPVLCMDISSDGDILVSGSADKNLKIWGLDFGDCHKSIFAHADSVMDVKFVRNTHYMFSVGKDRLVKYWDADKFELLLTLEGHHAEVWCLAVSSRGDFIVTGSHDRSIRRWDRTEEPFFIEEEREKRLEEVFESALDNLNEDRYAPKELVPDEGSVGVPGKETKETLSATDLIIDALDMADTENKRMDQHKEEQMDSKAVFQPNIMMRGLSPSDFVLQTLGNVNTNDLEPTLLVMRVLWYTGTEKVCPSCGTNWNINHLGLLVEHTVTQMLFLQSLPFSDALKLMSYLKEWVRIPDKVELVCRVTTVLLQTHHNQLTTAVASRPILTVLKDILHEKVKLSSGKANEHGLLLSVSFSISYIFIDLYFHELYFLGDILTYVLAVAILVALCCGMVKQELMSMRSDALFQDAKAKLMEIRQWQSKRTDSGEANNSRRKKKKLKPSNGALYRDPIADIGFLRTGIRTDGMKTGLDCAVNNVKDCVAQRANEVRLQEECDSVENDEAIARALQEELSRVAIVEESESSHTTEEKLQASVLSQNWLASTANTDEGISDLGRMEASTTLPMSDEKLSCEGQVEIEFTHDFSALDDEVCKRLNQMTPVPHIPKINGDIPSVDEEISDHQRLLDRLKLYDLIELKVQGDGNCQFRALSDQFYLTPEHHKFVREQVVNQLKSHPEIYQGSGEWGDHVTLQAAADSYGVKMFILTSFKDTCSIEILPSVEKSKRVICLSFWAEVHYNSIYPEGGWPSLFLTHTVSWN